MTTHDPAPRRAAGPGAFRRSALWTAVGTYLPGTGLIKAGRRKSGLFALIPFLLILAVFGGWALVNLSSLLQLGVNSTFLFVLVVVLPLLAIAWLAMIVATNLLIRPRRLTGFERGLSAVLVGLLSFTIAAPLAVAARYSYDQAQLVEAIFRSGGDIRSGTAPNLSRTNPWRNKPRVNILLLGGDAGADREGTRTDTVMLASIDTKTGDTVLISLPRNTANMPFPPGSPLHEIYPEGYTSGWGDDLEYMLTAMYHNLPGQVPPDILGPTDNLGADALKLSVGEATGLTVDYYVLLELQGFRELIDALGGITVNINTWVAVGGNTSAGIKPSGALRPGPDQHLNGSQAMWYARGRYGTDDYQRMDRQRCVVNAIIKQANPSNMLTRYEDVARASRDLILTDIPQELLPAFVDLSFKVKGANTKSIVLRNGEGGFHSSDPNFEVIRTRVASAIEPPKPTPAPQQPAQPQQPTPQASGSATATSSASASSSPSPTRTTASATPSGTATAQAPGTVETQPPVEAPPAEDLANSCQFQPEVAAAQPPVPPWEL